MTEPLALVATTRMLLACGIVAGPLYVVVAALQVLTRECFDLRRHAVSLLSNGRLGWIQIASFVITGLLVVAAAAGMRRSLRRGPGRRAGPLLVGLYGAGLVASGVFVADPADGFPPGTPPGAAEVLTWQGTLHLVAGGVAFLSLVAATVVFARRFAAAGQRAWARYSRATGLTFLAAWVGLVVTGAANPTINVAFAAAVVAGWAWLSAVAARLTVLRVR